MRETIPEVTYNEAWQIAGQCVERPYNQGTMRKAAAIIALALLARDERAAKIADQRVSNLIDQANEFFEYRDQGSAIIVCERAIEADLIASAIRDRSKT